MSRFSNDDPNRPESLRAWRKAKRQQAHMRNAVTPPEARRSTREEAAGRRLRGGQWVTP